VVVPRPVVPLDQCLELGRGFDHGAILTPCRIRAQNIVSGKPTLCGSLEEGSR
jgi:hypothetical protein